MIALRGVSLRYGEEPRAAFACESLDIGAGLTLLLGPNGAGKSSLLKIAAGVEQPDNGSISVDGHDLWRDEVAARAYLAYVPEHPDLTPYATVREIVDMVAALRGESVHGAERALHAMGLDDVAHRSVRELSMGQRRRAVLASAFVGEVRTVLLDEPLETMDRGTRVAIIVWVERLVAAGATIVIATHDIEPFVTLATRAIAVVLGEPTLIDPLPAERGARLALLERALAGTTKNEMRKDESAV